MFSRVLLGSIAFAVVVAWSSSACLAGIRNVSATASVSVDTAGTNTVNDVPFRDGDGGDIDGGTATAAAGLAVEGFGSSAVNGSVSLSSSSTEESASVSFGWSGDGTVNLADDNPFKSIGVSSSGSVHISFEVVGSPTEYSLTFTGGAPFAQVSLGGGGVSLSFCRASDGSCDHDNLVRGGTLPPGEYTVNASAADGAGLCIPPEGVTCPSGSPSFNANLNVTLTLSSAAAFRWVNPEGGPYAVAENWENNTVPIGQFDTALFGPVIEEGNETLLYAVTANAASPGRFIFDEAFVDLDGTAEVRQTSRDEPSLTIINGGKLNLDNGSRLSGVHASVGFEADDPAARSALLLTGAGTDCTLSGRLIVGETSHGDLSIDAGAVLTCSEAIVADVATGEASVIGAGSRWLTDAMIIGSDTGEGKVNVRDGASLEVIDEIIVGDLATGTLSLVDGGKTKAGELRIGNQQGGTGTVSLSGDFGQAPSSIEVTGALRVGVAGEGALDVDKGSSVHANELHFAASDSAGDPLGESRMILAGTDSDGAATDLTVFSAASLSHGELEVLNGAHANFLNLTLGSGGATSVRAAGFALTADGVDDTNSPATLTASRLSVGLDDLGTLQVDAGGQVTCIELLVSSLQTEGIGRVIANGGRINVNGPIRVSGESTDGDSIVIEGGGVLSADSLRLGDEPTPSTDSAELVIRNGTTDAPSQLSVTNRAANGPFAIGGAGHGVLRLSNHALAVVTGSATVGGTTPADGVVEIGADSSVSVSGDLTVGGASFGTIELLTSSSVLNIIGTLQVNAGGRIEGVGTLNADNRVVNTAGFIAPGLSPGTLTINGDYEQAEGGTLIMEAAGLEPGQFDILHVTKTATLGGTLEVRFLDGYLPREGDTLEFVQANGGISGDFTKVAFPDLAPGFNADLELRDNNRLRLIALNDAVAGDGMTLDDPGIVAQPLPSACGVGLCGAGGASMLPLVTFGLVGIRFRIKHRVRNKSH